LIDAICRYLCSAGILPGCFRFNGYWHNLLLIAMAAALAGEGVDGSSEIERSLEWDIMD